MADEATRLIGESDLFRGLEPEACRQLAACGRERRLRKREVLFFEGNRGVAVFLLLEGRVGLTKAAADGGEVSIRTIKPGESFAEVILFEQDRYPVTAAALTASRALSFARADLLRLLDHRPFRNAFIAALMRKQRYLAERVRHLASCGVEERLSAFLREQFGEGESITPGLSKKDVAAAIGTTPETFSRLLRRLGRRRLLFWRGKTLCIAPAFWERFQAVGRFQA